MPFTSAGLELVAASIVSFPRAPSIPSQQESRSHCVGAELYILLGPHTIVFLDCRWQTHSKVAVSTKEVERGSGIRAIQEYNPGTAWAACTSCVIRICHCLACVLSSLHTVNEIAPVVVLNHSSSLRTWRKGVFLEKCHRNSQDCLQLSLSQMPIMNLGEGPERLCTSSVITHCLWVNEGVGTAPHDPSGINPTWDRRVLP